jgi:hypothetical protein
MVKQKDPRLEFIYEDNPESVDVWVCGDWYPKGTFSNRIAGFPMNRLLKTQLDYLIKNVVNDWDFTLLICGEGEVRIGKSTIAQQISTYWTWSLCKLLNIKLPHSVEENIVFLGQELIRKGNKLGQKQLYSSLIFDEAGADLEGAKTMKQTTQAVKDYLRECGQYNMLNILVLPEFFDLPKGVALSRSIAMINVYWLPEDDGTFERGFFKFYNRPDKKKLYLLGKKDLDYSIWQETFYGRFPKFYTYDEVKYKQAKKEALKNREKLGEREKRQAEVTYALMRIVKEQTNASLDKLRDLINDKTFNIKISTMFLSRFYKKMRRIFGEDNEDEWETQADDDTGGDEED